MGKGELIRRAPRMLGRFVSRRSIGEIPGRVRPLQNSQSVKAATAAIVHARSLSLVSAERSSRRAAIAAARGLLPRSRRHRESRSAIPAEPARAARPQQGADPDRALPAVFAVAYPQLRQRLAASVAESNPTRLPDAAAVARLAVLRLMHGETLDAAQAAPVYVRDKVAFTVAERLIRGGKA